MSAATGNSRSAGGMLTRRRRSRCAANHRSSKARRGMAATVRSSVTRTSARCCVMSSRAALAITAKVEASSLRNTRGPLPVSTDHLERGATHRPGSSRGARLPTRPLRGTTRRQERHVGGGTLVMPSRRCATDGHYRKACEGTGSHLPRERKNPRQHPPSRPNAQGPAGSAAPAPGARRGPGTSGGPERGLPPRRTGQLPPQNRGLGSTPQSVVQLHSVAAFGRPSGAGRMPPPGGRR